MSRRFASLGLALALVCGLAPARESAAADTYAVDAVHSAVVFRIKHMNTSHSWGRFNELTGTFALDEASPSQSHFEFQVKTGSVDTGNAKRDQHIKGPDFFNATQFPTISFKSTSVAKGADGYDVTGELTLHGVTKPITVKIVPVGVGKGPTGGSIAGIDTSFTLKRSDFGMNKMVGPVGDDVWVNVSIEGGKK